MRKDAYGNPVTATRDATIAALDAYAADWTGYGTTLRNVFDAADDDSDYAFLQACAAAVHMALESRTGFLAAHPYLTRMRRYAAKANERERLFVESVDAWDRGDTYAAQAACRSLVKRYPADVASAKWGQYHAFNHGDTGQMLAFSSMALTAHSEMAEAWSMQAFALEQSGQTAEAEGAARQALTLKRSDPWAHHAIAHVLDRQERFSEGIRFLENHSDSWRNKSIFVREHNWWHLAVFHIETGAPQRALEIFDRELWGTWPEFAQEQIGAISALWRLELRGVDVGPRWQAIAAKIAARGCEHILPLHDLHYVYALERGGRSSEADSFVRSMARRDDDDGIWIAVALPAAMGILGHARGQHSKASEFLGSVVRDLHLIGGSTTQRELFQQTWLSSAAAADGFSASETLPSRRRLSPARMAA